MAEVTKYQLISSTNGGILSDMKSQFALFKTKNKGIVVFIYGFMFCFVIFTVFLAFSPSTNSSSPWFFNIFTTTTTTSNTTAFVPAVSTTTDINPPPPSHDSGSTPTSNYPPPTPISEDNTLTRSNNQVPLEVNQTNSQVVPAKGDSVKPNRTIDSPSPVTVSNLRDGGTGAAANSSVTPGEKDENLKSDHTAVQPPTSPLASPAAEKKNEEADAAPAAENKDEAARAAEKKEDAEPNNNKVAAAPINSTAASQSQPSPEHPGNNSTSVSAKPGKEKDLINQLVNCDLYDGGWIRDDSYPLYKPGSCSFFDEQFSCQVNGRPDTNYMKLKWQPKGCTLPRLNGKHMLKLLRGKRLAFVGDSLNRNMWESLVCILRNSVEDKKKVFESHGRMNFRSEAFYSFVFQEYECTIEFFATPFLVRQWEVKEKNGESKETLRLDLIAQSASQFKNADIIVFNTGHWWTHEKTSKGQDYYQEGSHVYPDLNVVEAFRRAITTWGRWVDANVNPSKTHVLYRGYSASHFSGGQWNSGGACDNETEPITEEAYLTPYPWKMKVFEKVVKGIKTPVSYLNVTRLTDFRKDGHPSIYRKKMLTDEEKRSPLKYQDCSHWCLPGVPDAWNELLYAELLRKRYMDQQQRGRR